MTGIIQDQDQIKTFLPKLFELYPFDQLSPLAARRVASKVRLNVYRPGELILEEGVLPSFVHVLVHGKARILGPAVDDTPSLQVVEDGVFGWDGLIRRVAVGSVRAAGLEDEVFTLSLPADEFEQLMLSELLPKLDQTSLLELYDIISQFIETVPIRLSLPDFKTITSYIYEHDLAVVFHWFPASDPLSPLSEHYVWFLSGGASVSMPIGVPVQHLSKLIATRSSALPVRLIGIRRAFVALLLNTGSLPEAPEAIEAIQKTDSDSVLKLIEGLISPDQPPPQRKAVLESSRKTFPVHLSRSSEISEYLIACYWMVCDFLQVPYRPDILRKWFAKVRRVADDRMSFYGRVAEALGLQTQLVKFTPTAGGLNRIKTPSLITIDGVPSILYEITQATAVIGSPISGLIRVAPEQVAPQLEIAEVVSGTQLSHALVLDRQATSPIKQFGWSWFLPYIRPYRGVLIQVLIASIFVQLLGLANPLLTQQIIDKVVVNGSAGALPMFGILLVVFTIVEAVLSILRTYLLNSTTNRVDLMLGTEIVRHMLNLPLDFFQKRPVGELASRISELENIRQFLTGTFLTVVLDSVFSIIYIFVMAFYSLSLTLCVLAFIPIIIGLTVFGSPIIQKLIRRKADQNSRMQSYLIEILNGIFTVKSQNMEKLVQANWRDQYLGYLGTGFRTTMVGVSFQSINNFVNNLSSLLVLWVGGGLVLNGQLTLGGLIAFRIIAGYVTGPLIRLSRLWQKLQETNLSMELLADVVDTPMEFAEEEANLSLPPIVGRVQFELISFGFQSSGQLQLTDICLDIPAGSFTGLVGQSGSGKSTLVKLLPRLYTPSKGDIYLDGYDLSKVSLVSLRRQMGIVPQDPVLFDGTIRDNITLFSEVDDNAVMEAAKVAEAHEFIMSLQKGYDSRTGERGSNLSGGQRQRIAIARMVLQNPRLLILDEATSALDYETERRVVDNLMERFRGRTVFFITHRLSNLRNADHIVYLQHGSVMEQGSHEELMARRQMYYALYSQQVDGV
ncbi:peptidase domain-containing ABC transporter [Leptolyngbya sp. AN03gr2]|uniref:peptidase domain-containing ABC transporter n=1 Tax=unclassified Leptolyngbya TaxID=2650499 RepID=UPI003D31A4F2